MDAPRALITYLPGVIVLCALHAMILATGGRFLYEERLSIWQALDPQSLQQEYWASLWSLHMQPPLLNAIYGVTDGPRADTSLHWLFLACAVATVLAVVHTLRLEGVDRWWAAFAGVAYAALPATVLYALFPYSTTVAALLATVMVWGLALMSRHAAVGAAISAAGAAALFLARASFAWPLALGWLVMLLILLWRRAHAPRPHVASAGRGHLGVAAGFIGLAALLIALVQGHALIAFSSPTLSTWSSQTAFRGISESGLSAESKAALAAQDPCFAELITVGAFQPASAYPVCLADAEPVRSGTQALDERDKRSPGIGPNFNAGQYLQLSPQWSALEMAALRTEPTAVLRMVFGHDDREGSLGVFLGRSDQYYDTLDLMKTGPTVIWGALGAWSAVFPWLAWVLTLLAALSSFAARVRRHLPVVFWAALGVLIAHAFVSTVGNYGENQRFRAEMDPVLIIVATLGAVAIARSLRSVGDRPTGS